MAKFGTQSLRHRGELHEDLKLVLDAAIKEIDFSIIEGFRSESEQNKAFAAGVSRARWPESHHNIRPSNAVDIIPYPTGWASTNEDFAVLATHILAQASKLGIRLKWGGHFKGFFDGAHFERIGE